jgi:hypothetical protein
MKNKKLIYIFYFLYKVLKQEFEFKQRWPHISARLAYGIFIVSLKNVMVVRVVWLWISVEFAKIVIVVQKM